MNDLEIKREKMECELVQLEEELTKMEAKYGPIKIDEVLGAEDCSSSHSEEEEEKVAGESDKPADPRKSVVDGLHLLIEEKRDTIAYYQQEIQDSPDDREQYQQIIDQN